MAHIKVAVATGQHVLIVIFCIDGGDECYHVIPKFSFICVDIC